jgi:hypothetical protein
MLMAYDFFINCVHLLVYVVDLENMFLLHMQNRYIEL